MKKYQTTKSGFSLIESLVAIFIFSLVAALLAGSFSGFFKTYVSARKTQKNMESGQYVMNLMAKTIRSSTINPNFPTSGLLYDDEIMMFDNSKSECVIYKYDVDGALKSAALPGTDIDSCNATPPTSFFPLTNAGEISGVTFAGIPSSDDGTVVGKILIKINTQSDNASQMQTTVSLRDKKAIEVLQVATPSASPAGGSYSSTQSVTLSSATSGAAIRYTTDGSNPTATSTLYTGAISVSSTTTLKALAIKAGMTNSAVMNETYIISIVVATPSASPAGGSYSSMQSVTLSTATSGAAIRYTTDGSNPTATSTLYTGAISVSSTTTLKALAIKAGMTNSAVMSETYTISVATPSASPTGGVKTTAQSIVLSTVTAGATIHYTTSGADPTTASPVYSSPIAIANGVATTIKAIAVKSGMANSSIMTESYAFNWIAGPCAGFMVYKDDISGGRQWKVSNDECNTPQCGLDGAQNGDKLISDNSFFFFGNYPARAACQGISGRLPDMTELACIYTNRNSYGSFIADRYWSSEEFSLLNARNIIFSTGNTNTSNKAFSANVRCIK